MAEEVFKNAALHLPDDFECLAETHESPDKTRRLAAPDPAPIKIIVAGFQRGKRFLFLLHGSGTPRRNGVGFGVFDRMLASGQSLRYCGCNSLSVSRCIAPWCNPCSGAAYWCRQDAGSPSGSLLGVFRAAKQIRQIFRRDPKSKTTAAVFSRIRRQAIAFRGSHSQTGANA